MKILGIDPGLDVTGYGIIETKGKSLEFIDAGAINTSKKDKLPSRLLKIFNGVEQIIKRYQPQVVVIEELYSHYKHPTTAILMGHARACACLACTLNGIPVQGYRPTRIKKAVVGRGNATKEQVARMVAAHLGLKRLEEPDDVTDALAMAIGHAFIERHNLKANLAYDISH